MYSYLGSVRSLQNDGNAAIAAYERATVLDPNDVFAAHAVKRFREAQALKPVPVAASPAGRTLEDLRLQNLPGYDAAALPPSRRDVAIAVIATGISPEVTKLLGPRLVHSSSVVHGEPDADDHNGHGTSVISLAAALAPSAKIVSIKSLSSTGGGTNAVIADGVRKAISEHANVILLPLGVKIPSKEIQDAVTEALGAGALVVAAGGNDGSDQPFFPASYSGVIAVGAVDASNKLAPFSNRGPGFLYAPGVDILVLEKDDKLATRSGTSFSAAIAAAIAAVVWAAKPDLSAQQIRELLIATSADLGPVDPTNSRLGKLRRIDAIAASRHTS